MSTPSLYYRILDACTLRAEHAREQGVQLDHLRHVLRAAVGLLSPRQLRSLEDQEAVADLFEQTEGLS